MVTTFGTLVEAIEIVRALPGVADAISKLGLTFQKLIASKDKELPEDSLARRIIDEALEELRRLIDEFWAIAKRSDIDTVEKNEKRARIAAQACKLLKFLEPFKEEVPDYKSTSTFFCETVPSTLAAG